MSPVLKPAQADRGVVGLGLKEQIDRYATKFWNLRSSDEENKD